VFSSPNSFFYPKPYFFCDLQLLAKLHNPRTTPSGKKYVAQKEKEKRKIIPNKVDTSFRSNAQGQRKHSAWTNTAKFQAQPSPSSSFNLLSRRPIRKSSEIALN
jgi:hypothetical protein